MHDNSLDTFERTACDTDAVADAEEWPWLSREARAEERMNGGNFLFVYGLWAACNAENVDNAGRRENGETFGRVETREDIARKKRELDRANPV